MAALEDNTRWTFARMEAELPPESRYELHAGVLLAMSPSPSAFHQDIVLNLGVIFKLFLKETRLGKVFLAPLDVVLAPAEVVQPDLLILLGDPNRRILGPVQQVPDLVVEILSPGNTNRDTVDKKDLYAQYGIKEYWIIDPEVLAIDIFALQDSRYVLSMRLVESGVLKSALLPGLEIELEEVFR